MTNLELDGAAGLEPPARDEAVDMDDRAQGRPCCQTISSIRRARRRGHCAGLSPMNARCRSRALERRTPPRDTAPTRAPTTARTVSWTPGSNIGIRPTTRNFHACRLSSEPAWRRVRPTRRLPVARCGAVRRPPTPAPLRRRNRRGAPPASRARRGRVRSCTRLSRFIGPRSSTEDASSRRRPLPNVEPTISDISRRPLQTMPSA